jgi:hypothetical protein
VGHAKSRTVDFETHLEFVQNTRFLDEFVRGLFEYKMNVTGNTTSVPLTTAGTTTNETFPALQLFQFVKNQSAADVLASCWPQVCQPSRHGAGTLSL